MKTNEKLISVLIVFSILIGTLAAQTTYKNYQDGKIWFKIKANKSNGDLALLRQNPNHIPLDEFTFIAQLSEKYHIDNLSKPFYMAKTSSALQNTYLVQFSAIQKVDALIQDISTSNEVDYAEKVPLNKVYSTPNDPYFNQQWYLKKINAEKAWDYTTGDSNIVVAVVDNAIAINHQDLKANIWTNPGEIPNNNIDDDGNGFIDDIHGYDVGDNDNDPTPLDSTFFHGTLTSSLVGAVTNNHIGIASIGHGISIMAVKATRDISGPKAVTDGYAGISYAAATGARVINCSWGGIYPSRTGQNVINDAWNQGAIIVAAAGNDGNSKLHYPAAFKHVYAVASTNKNDKLSGFSCYGSWVDISAPGRSIIGAMPNNKYAKENGTSLSAPIVSGLCGLILSFNPSMSQTDVLNCINNTAINVDSKNSRFIGQMGAGRIDAAAALACASSTLNDPPIAYFSANDRMICTDGLVSFTDQSTGNPTSWFWFFPGGTPSFSMSQNPGPIQYNHTGTYDVTLIAIGASNTDTIHFKNYIDVSVCTGINKISDQNKITAHYDGRSKAVILKTNHIHKGKYTISILNSLGQNLTHTEMNIFNNAQEFKFDMNGLSRGIYFIRLTSSFGQYTKKIMKY